MARSYYFQLQPEGLGTPNVECLSSYIHRLALAHGVTFYQLHAHLRHWFSQQHPNRKMPRGCESVRFNGYGGDVKLLVEALEEATSLDVLRACTLLPVSEVCAGNGIGAVKRTRAWCPACYGIARERGAVIYDRLYWQIQGITRCPIHGIELKQVCDVCGQIQRNQSSRNILDRCEHCTADLVGDPESWSIIANQDLYEVPLTSLLSFTSQNPAITFSTRAMSDYCRYMVDVHSRRKLIDYLGEIFHCPGNRTRMQLSSMLHVSAFFNVSLALALTEPQVAASQMSLEFEWPARRQCKPHPRVNDEASRRAGKLIRQAIASGPPFPSLRSISALVNVSEGYLIYRLRHSVRELAKCRREEISRQRNGAVRRIRYWSKRASSLTTIRRERDKVRWIADHAKAPVNVVRRHHDNTSLQAGNSHLVSRWKNEPSELEKQKLLNDGRWLTSAQVMKFLGIGYRSIWNAQPLQYLRSVDRIFFVKYRGRCYYSDVQFSRKDRSVLAVVPKLLGLLPPSPGGWCRSQWLFEHSALLGARPADLLRDNPESVLRFAQEAFVPRSSGDGSARIAIGESKNGFIS